MLTNRTRIWSFIVYPESAPTDWEHLLASECVPAIISPLHDKDLNPDNTPKKPHWHVLLMYSGPKSQTQVQAVCDKLNATIPVPVANLQGMARYLIHKDNPEKYQYDSTEIKNLSGADWSNIIKTSKDRYDMLEAIFAFIREKDIRYYSDLIDYCRENNRDWFECCCDNTILLRGYCIASSTKQKESEDVRRLNALSSRPVELH